MGKHKISRKQLNRQKKQRNITISDKVISDLTYTFLTEKMLGVVDKNDEAYSKLKNQLADKLEYERNPDEYYKKRGVNRPTINHD